MRDERYCPGCEWTGYIEDCVVERDYDHDPVDGRITYIAVPLCPICAHYVIEYMDKEGIDG